MFVDNERCVECGFCRSVGVCHGGGGVLAALACYYACPYEARVLRFEEVECDLVKMIVDGVKHAVPMGLALRRPWRALASGSGARVEGLDHSMRPWGCLACAVLIDGGLERLCITPVRDGMRIELDVEEVEPLRIVHAPQSHGVCGKATSWWGGGCGSGGSGGGLEESSERG